MWLKLSCLLIIASAVNACETDWCYHPDCSWALNDWGSGAEWMIETYAARDYHNGWHLQIKFEKKVQNFQIWNVDVVEEKDNVFYTRGLAPGSLNNGDKLSMNCIGNFDGGWITPPQIRLCEHQDCSCSTNPTNPPVTNPPVTNDPGDPVTNDPGQPCQPAPDRGPYNYGEVLKKSILFYEAQRSGWLPENNRIHYRSHSATNDGWYDVGFDLTGGWYDAGDHVKFQFPMAQTATTLIYGLIEFADAYQEACQLEIMRDSVRWVLDYFVKAHPTKNELYMQVADGYDDHAFWGRPEEMTMGRPAFKVDTSKPGSDVAGETAAAMAAGSIAFRNVDTNYADTLLSHAKDLYEFANNYRAKYSDSFPPAVDFYGSTGYGDELAWAAAWLHRATGERRYLDEAEGHYDSFGLGGLPWSFSWDAKAAGVQILLYQLTGSSKYQNDVTAFLDSWLPGGGITYTPKGLAWRDQWGPNRYSGNTAFIACLAVKANIPKSENYKEFARKQINYMLGDGGRSFVIGFGKNPPNAPHHRSSSCPNLPAPCNWDNFYSGGANPQELTGALVGGPDQYDNFENDRKDYIMNEVATDYNAGFQSAVAGVLIQY